MYVYLSSPFPINGSVGVTILFLLLKYTISVFVFVRIMVFKKCIIFFIHLTGLFFKVYQTLLHHFLKSRRKCCHEEVKIKFRLVRQLDVTIPSHRKILIENDAAAEIANFLPF